MISREMLQAMMAKMTGNNYSRPTNFNPPGSNGYNAGNTMHPAVLDQMKRMGSMKGGGQWAPEITYASNAAQGMMGNQPTNFIPPGSNGYNAGRTMDPAMLDQLKRMGMMGGGQPVNRELADPNMMQTAERAGMMANPDMRARMMQQMQSAQGMMGNRPANFTPPGSNGYNANRAVSPGMMGGLQAALAAMKSKIMP